jgi:aspartate racemase
MIGDKCLGIIGGHGYNAAIELQFYINEEINRNMDTRNYIKTFVINDATVNSDNETVLDLYENTDINSNVEMSIYNAYNSLIKLGCNIITIPCNTYSNLLSKNKNIKKSDIRIINIVDATKDWINYNFPMIKKIGLIATQQTIASRLYQDRLINYDIVSFKELKYDINSIILCTQYGYYNRQPTKELLLKLKIDNESLVEKMNRIIDIFVKNGINHIILGCTELPLFVKYNKINLNSIIFIDTMEILAKEIVNNN